MLGEGGFCNVAAFVNKEGQEFALKYARQPVDTELQCECTVLKLLDAAAVPRVPKLISTLTSAAGKLGLMLAPVGTPLLQHPNALAADPSDRWALAVHVATQIADTLASAHKAGALHCDVRPSNIVLVGERAEAVLIDWGLGSIAAEVRKRKTLFGVPAFMADDLVKLGDMPQSTEWQPTPQHDMCALVYTCAAIAGSVGAVSPWGAGFVGCASSAALLRVRRRWLHDHLLPKRGELPLSMQAALDVAAAETDPTPVAAAAP